MNEEILHLVEDSPTNAEGYILEMPFVLMDEAYSRVLGRMVGSLLQS